jgi:hypothetical protein
MNIRSLKAVFVLVDLGFVAYWIFAWLHLFPRDYLFKDYDNPILDAWNFSFLPLDLLVSATGLSSIWCHSRGRAVWQPLALLSLTLTFCSGLQAVAFWWLRRDFDPTWWIPNVFLMVYPLLFLRVVLFAPVLVRETRTNADRRSVVPQS